MILKNTAYIDVITGSRCRDAISTDEYACMECGQTIKYQHEEKGKKYRKAVFRLPD
jgi:hypothetical protein